MSGELENLLDQKLEPLKADVTELKADVTGLKANSVKVDEHLGQLDRKFDDLNRKFDEAMKTLDWMRGAMVRMETTLYPRIDAALSLYEGTADKYQRHDKRITVLEMEAKRHDKLIAALQKA